MRPIHAVICALALTISAPVDAQDPKKPPAARTRRPQPQATPPGATAPEATAPEATTEATAPKNAEEPITSGASPSSDAAAEESAAPNESTAAEEAERAPAPERGMPHPRGCTPSRMASVLERYGDSLVYVEAPGAQGLGFVFHSPRHVLTALSIVERGRGIRVHFQGGQWSATVVAMDRESDLALLELDGDAPAVPIPLGRRSPATGASVIALRKTNDAHHPMAEKHRRQLRWWHPADTIAELGRVNFSGAGRFRTDALGGHHDSWGAPLLDCYGRVVGVATSPISDEAVTVARVRSLVADVTDEPVYDGRWSIFNPSLGLVGQLTHTPSAGFSKRDKWLGFSAGTALIGDDRWFFPARFTATFLVTPGLDEPFAERSGFRVAGSAGLGYRIMLKGGGIPLYVVPVVGATLMFERITTERTDFWVDEACAEAPCRVTPAISTVEEEQLRLMPTFGGGLQLGRAEAAYQFILDTEHHEFSVHQLTLGAQF